MRGLQFFKLLLVSSTAGLCSGYSSSMLVLEIRQFLSMRRNGIFMRLCCFFMLDLEGFIFFSDTRVPCYVLVTHPLPERLVIREK